MHPLRTPSGITLTRDAPEDHPWHHGLWFTIKFVNEENFWEEYDAYGVLRHVDDTTVHWIRPDRETVVIVDERTPHPRRRSASTTPTPSTGTSPSPRRSTSSSTAPSSRRGAATAASPCAAAATGPTRACCSPTAPSTSGCSASRGDWLDLAGTIEGGEAGVLLLDHPANPRHPVPWYASTKAATYGDEGWSNFANAAFLWHDAARVAGADAAAVPLPDRGARRHAGTPTGAAAEWERYTGG